MGLDIGGAEGNSFPFNNIGDSVTGQILTLEEVQQTDMKTGELTFWNNNPAQPKMMYRVTLQTDLRDDPSDDGKRAIYLRGSRKPEKKSSLGAVLQAVKAATGGTSLDPGATVTLAYVGDGIAQTRGFDPPKQYEAQYRPAPMNLGEQQQTQPPAQAAPPQQPPTQQQPPAPAQQPPQQAAQQAQGPTPEQVAALRAAGIDPATVFPNVA